MKLNEINSTNSTRDEASDLVKKYIIHELNGGTIYSFLSQFDFDSREEIIKAVRDLAIAIVGDKYVSDKYTQETFVRVRCMYKRFNTICTNPDKFDKYPIAVSGEIWHGGYNRKKMLRNAEDLLTKNIPSGDEWQKACENIKRIYQLTDRDVAKLHFFCCQVKAGAEFPNSLRRMLYIWGATKMTGKTTTATMLTSILNGETNYNNIAKYSTSLAYEMQIRSFAVPKISECNVCLMDECFYADMGKTYADFKRFMTSSGGVARLPFGQEFSWDGYPNYIATSNDPLKRFIKDWNDRRYLSIEFKAQPTAQLAFDDIYNIWLVFVRGCERSKAWKEWADEISSISNEVGERTERANEFEIELQRSVFISHLCNMSSVSDKASSSDNHISLKFFVDYFAREIGAQEAQKRREEIEQSVLAVFGPRYSTQTYWLLSDLKKRAEEIKLNMYAYESENAIDEDFEGVKF